MVRRVVLVEPPSARLGVGGHAVPAQVVSHPLRARALDAPVSVADDGVESAQVAAHAVVYEVPLHFGQRRGHVHVLIHPQRARLGLEVRLRLVAARRCASHLLPLLHSQLHAERALRLRPRHARLQELVHLVAHRGLANHGRRALRAALFQLPCRIEAAGVLADDVAAVQTGRAEQQLAAGRVCAGEAARDEVARGAAAGKAGFHLWGLRPRAPFLLLGCLSSCPILSRKRSGEVGMERLAYPWEVRVLRAAQRAI
mmetsp:Transcript_47775/g.119620  ORF Transcript_47775/g.119620 Transcript_47775/m.119620 type:complete len:256 (-) Transcript_47775:173-940(-)